MRVSRLLPIAASAAFTLSCLLAPTPADAQARSSVEFPYSEGYEDGTDFFIERQIAPGFLHSFEGREEGPAAISTIVVETGREEVVIDPRSGGDTLRMNETVPSMVERLYSLESRPLAAVNSDFWGSGGVPIGMFVADGTIWNGPHRRYQEADVPSRSVFAWNEDGEIYIGATALEVLLQGPDGAIPIEIDRINPAGSPPGTALYTWPLGDGAPAPPEGHGAFAIDVPGGQLLPNSPAPATVASGHSTGELPLSRTQAVVHLEDPAPNWMAEGTEVTIDIRFPELDGVIVGASGGGPLLLRDGENVAEFRNFAEGWNASFLNTAHPRTAIGVKEDGTTVVAVVVDGRQPGRATGISLQDLADLLREKGAVHAMNLDGGGSSTMVVDGALSNFPSDTAGARSIKNALLFRRVAPLGDPVGLEVRPENFRLPVGASRNISVRAVSESGERFPLTGGDWSLYFNAAGGQVEPFIQLPPGETAATVRGRLPGRTEIRATAVRGDRMDLNKPVPAGAATVIVEEATALTFQPPAVLLQPGESLPVRLLATSPSGPPFSDGFFFEEMDMPGFVTYSRERGTVEALSDGAGKIHVKAAGQEAVLPVAVSHYSEVPLADFDSLPEGEPEDLLNLLNAKEELSALTLERENVHRGEGAWRLRYGMAEGGSTRIAIPFRLELPTDNPMALGVWVYGDGKGQWLRAQLQDADNRTIYADFTSANPGIDWEGEWRHVRANLQTAIPAGSMTPPYTLRYVYLVQPDGNRKADGEIVLDGLSLLELPEELLEP